MRIDTIDSVNLIITGKCDSKCGSCSYWLTGKEFLSFDFIKTILPQLAKYKIKAIRLTGGEPTLHPNFVEIAALLKQEMDAYIVLNSHGNNLPEVFPKICDYIDAYILSLDSSTRNGYRKTRGVDWFDIVVQLPRMIHDYYPNVFVAYSTVVQKQNFHELVDIIKLSQECGVDLLSFNIPTVLQGPYANALPRLINQTERLLLSENEIEQLEEIIENVIDYTSRRPGFLLQSPETLRQYPIALRHAIDRERFPLPTVTCGLPSSSIVINEHGFVKPCFILPDSFKLDHGADPINHAELVTFRDAYSASTDIKENSCKQCYVYPYLLAEQEV